MTDQIQALYNDAISRRPKYFDKDGHDDFEPDSEFNITKDVCEAFAAREVDRLLDCFGMKFSGGTSFNITGIYEMPEGMSESYGWGHSSPFHQIDYGKDKASLLRYVGFSLGGG